MKTRDQERAAFVLAAIEQTYPHGIPKEHANYFAGLPSMILENGLGQTMVFLLSKGRTERRDNKYRFSYTILRKYLFPNPNFNEEDTPLHDVAMLENLNNKPMQEYFEAQREAIALATWLKRYARALEIPSPSTNSNDKKG